MRFHLENHRIFKAIQCAHTFDTIGKRDSFVDAFFTVFQHVIYFGKCQLPKVTCLCVCAHVLNENFSNKNKNRKIPRTAVYLVCPKKN